MCQPGQAFCVNGCIDVSADVNNCGSCLRQCPRGPNAAAACSGGTCTFQCAPGFADCDFNPMNGCEADLSDPATCGSCRNACPSGLNAAAACTMGVCGLTCAPGFGNCDFVAANGCEGDLSAPSSCGSCNNRCRTGPNQTASCVMGLCGAQCSPGFADCDLFPGTGCEANLSSAATCGSCSNACPSGGANTMATCTLSTCGTQCRPGFANCDGNLNNGCEADLNALTTCGSCTTVCPTGQLCTGGSCGGGCPALPVGVLTPNTTVMGTLTAGPARFPLPTCSTQSNRTEDLWTFTLTTASSVILETGGMLDTVLVVRSSCTATTDLACNDDTPGIGTRSRVSLMLQPGTYSVLVKEWGGNATGGAYSLSATVSSAPNAICTAPTPLNPGIVLRGENSSQGGVPSTACSPGGGQLFYRVTLSPNQRAVVSVTSTTASLTTRLLSACTATSCTDVVQGSGTQTLTFDNRGFGTQTLIISVSATTSGVNASFEILAEVIAIPSNANSSCALATPLTVNGMPINGEVIDTGGAALTSCLPGQVGRTRYYSVLVPARSAVQVNASSSGFDLALRVFSSCATLNTCAAFADGTVGIAPERVRITNPANFSQTYIVVASSAFPGSGATYSINAATASPPAAANAFCNTPTPLTSGVAIAGELALPGGLPLHNVCLPSQAGYARYYSVLVPSGSTLHAVVSPGAVDGLDVGARVLTNCAASTCSASSDAPGLASEAVVVSNTSGFSQTLVIAASGVNTNPTASNDFSVLANVAVSASNATCAGSTAMSVGVPLLNETLTGGGAPNTACLPTVTGLTKYYRVSVAAGERVKVSAVSTNFDVSLRVFDSCGAAACAASANAVSGFGEETVTLQNETGGLKTWVLAVSAPATTTTGTFSISVTRTPYSLTRIGASCSDLSLAPDLMGPGTVPVIDDDLGTVPLALPFPMTSFSTPVTHFSACMNGYVQLFTSAAGPADCDFTNTALPNAANPSGLVAPLWDDLQPAGPLTRVRSLTTGVSPSRAFVVEWIEASFLGAGTGAERVQFQAKLFESTGVIEFHYCSLAPNGGSADVTTGSTSTIGLENLTHTDAMLHSFNAANSVASGGGLRFVPQ